MENDFVVVHQHEVEPVGYIVGVNLVKGLSIRTYNKKFPEGAQEITIPIELLKLFSQHVESGRQSLIGLSDTIKNKLG